MQGHWINKAGASDIAVFILGWGANPSIISHLEIPNSDIFAICDYKDIETYISDHGKINTLLAHYSLDSGSYSRMNLYAWSFGVWIAENIFNNIEWNRAIAFNGSPFPVNEHYGISPRRLAATIKGMSKAGTGVFYRNAYGDAFLAMEALLSPRGLESDIEELQALSNAAARPYSPSIKWNKAIIGAHDTIFPPENLTHYWTETAMVPTEILPLHHYPFMDSGIIAKEFGNR